MRENRQSGSEGGVGESRFRPLSLALSGPEQLQHEWHTVESPAEKAEVHDECRHLRQARPLLAQNRARLSATSRSSC